MHDFEGPAWAEHRGQWTTTVGGALRLFADGLAHLQHRRFTAPWRSDAARCG